MRICTKTILLIPYIRNGSCYILQRRLFLPSPFACEIVNSSSFLINLNHILLPKRLRERENRERWARRWSMVWWVTKATVIMGAANQGQAMLPHLKPCLVPERLWFMSLLSTQVPTHLMVYHKDFTFLIFLSKLNLGHVGIEVQFMINNHLNFTS